MRYMLVLLMAFPGSMAAQTEWLDSTNLSRFRAIRDEYQCDTTMLARRRGSALHIGDGPCEVLRAYGAEFEEQHVANAVGQTMSWYFEDANALFWFLWDPSKKRWTLTDAVTH